MFNKTYMADLPAATQVTVTKHEHRAPTQTHPKTSAEAGGSSMTPECERAFTEWFDSLNSTATLLVSGDQPTAELAFAAGYERGTLAMREAAEAVAQNELSEATTGLGRLYSKSIRDLIRKLPHPTPPTNEAKK